VKEENQVKHYIRYMDDMVLILPTKAQASNLLAQMVAFANQQRGLEFNAKTQISPVRAGVRYLGWHFYLAASGKLVRKLDSKKKARLRKSLHTLPRKFATGELDVREVRARVASTVAHLEHGHTYALRRAILDDLVF
jgi:hypothetical protein